MKTTTYKKVLWDLRKDNIKTIREFALRNDMTIKAAINWIIQKNTKTLRSTKCSSRGRTTKTS